MSDYYMAVDSDGRCVIQHGTEWKNHKFLMRIGKGADAIYLYTLAEVRAYLRGQKNSPQTIEKNNTSHVDRLKAISRTRNITGKAQPIEKKEIGNNSSASKISASANDKNKKRRHIDYKYGQFYETVESRDKNGNKTIKSAPANNKDATLFGNKEDRGRYREQLYGLRLNKRRKKINEILAAFGNEKAAENLKKRDYDDRIKKAEQAVEIAKRKYDLTRTLDDIPDYLITRGQELLKDYIVSHGGAELINSIEKRR